MNQQSAESLKRERARSVFPDLVTLEDETREVALGGSRRVSTLLSDRDALSIGGSAKVTALSFSNMHEHGDLLASFMRERKKVFIDELHWDLPTTDGMEFDQYDTPFAKWLVIHEFGKVLGGLRLSPTTAQVGIYSYMLRDAQNGILANIPTDVLFIKAPVHENIWEGTRLFISDDVAASRRLSIQMLLIHHLLVTARELGASHLIGFVPSQWYRWIRRMDLQAVAIGPKVNIDGSVSQAALMKVIQFVN